MYSHATGKDRIKRGLGMGEGQSGLEAGIHMTRWMTRTLGAALLALATTAATAQESTNVVGTATDWSIFTENDPKECWGVSPPKETVNTRDGQPVSVRRGDILLFVTFRPGSAAGEVSFTGGYAFALDAPITLQIGSDSFNLNSFPDDPATSGFNENEWAWTASPADDATLLVALKSGTTAILTARSRKGTQTKDTFSLRGFTAAMDEAAKRCAS